MVHTWDFACHTRRVGLNVAYISYYTHYCTYMYVIELALSHFPSPPSLPHSPTPPQGPIGLVCLLTAKACGATSVIITGNVSILTV